MNITTAESVVVPSDLVPDISVVIPLFNESESLQTLHGELSAIAEKDRRRFEFIFVDDGSTDGGWDTIGKLRTQDSRIAAIRLRRNFGKSAALAAGFAAASGAIVVTMDADLQDNPREMPAMLERIEHGFDLVSGWKKVRNDPWHKTMPSRVFNIVVSKLTGVTLHDHNCGFKAYRREVLAEIPLYGELYRFIPVLAAARGFRIAEVAVNHRPRKFGKSKFGWRRFTRGFLDLLTVQFLTNNRHRPQHLFGGLGLFSLLIGLISAGWISLRAALAGSPIGASGSHWLIALGGILLGVQLLVAGLLAELIVARNFREGETYSVAESLPRPVE